MAEPTNSLVNRSDLRQSVCEPGREREDTECSAKILSDARKRRPM
jgi:hypothetical protein